MFIGSGLYGVRGANPQGKKFELCLNCGNIDWAHDINYGQCPYSRWTLTYHYFDDNGLGLKGFQNFFFRRYQYLSGRVL